MQLNRRKLVAGVGAAIALPAWSQSSYPTKPVRWVVGYPPGGGTDFLARTIAGQLSQQMGQQVYVENRAGAAGIIAAEHVARSAPDGYTVFTADNGILVYNTALYKRLPYSPERNFDTLGLMTRAHLVLVTAPASGFRDIQSVMRAARAQPGQLSYASPGAGSPHHLAMEWFKSLGRIHILHIPYRGGAAALQDVMGNQLPLMLLDMPSGFGAVASGKVVPLLSFSGARIPLLKDVPTAKEIGLRMETYAWQGVVAPAGTPVEIQRKFNVELQAALANETVRRKLADAGLDPIPGDPAHMNRYVAEEVARWHPLIKERELTLD